MRPENRGMWGLVAAVCVLVAGALWAVRGFAPGYADVTATSVAAATAIVALVAPRLFPGTVVILDDQIDQAAAALTAALIEQWAEEEAVRGYAHNALPVRFTYITDHARTSVPVVTNPASNSGPIGAFDEIAALVTGPPAPGCLVVLGALGAGKSAVLLRLSLMLLRARIGTGPVPVMLSAGGWDPTEDLEAWVAAQLIEQYPLLRIPVSTMGAVRRSLAAALVARRRVLPMIDGLDELETANRAVAWHSLSEAVRRGLPLVVTCRTAHYRDLTTAGAEPLERAVVIELGPSTPADVRVYLPDTTAGPAQRWNTLLAHLDANPYGVLAEVLATPLMVWLTRMVYRRSATTPGELIALASHPDQTAKYLLDGLVPAAYAERSRLRHYPARVGPEFEPIQRALEGVARHLRKRKSTDFAWWRLHEQVPARRIAATTAALTGGTLGPAVGVAVAAKYGVLAGVISGACDAVVAGLLCAVTVMIPKPGPRTLNPHLSLRSLRLKPLGGLSAGLAVGLSFGYATAHGGGVWAGTVVLLAVGPVSAVAVGSVFGPFAGATGGLSSALAFGLAGALVQHRGPGLVPGMVTGVVFMVMGWLWTGLYQPAQTPHAVSPDLLYRGDKSSSLVVGLTSGLAYGIAFLYATGVRIGALAFVVLSFAVTLTVSSWGQFAIACLWRPLGSGTPRDVMGLLREAHERGVLRQNGIYYQFRHDLLAENLAVSSTPSRKMVP